LKRWKRNPQVGSFILKSSTNKVQRFPKWIKSDHYWALFPEIFIVSITTYAGLGELEYYLLYNGDRSGHAATL
jgi:hypothetical protein